MNRSVKYLLTCLVFLFAILQANGFQVLDSEKKTISETPYSEEQVYLIKGHGDAEIMFQGSLYVYYNSIMIGRHADTLNLKTELSRYVNEYDTILLRSNAEIIISEKQKNDSSLFERDVFRRENHYSLTLVIIAYVLFLAYLQFNNSLSIFYFFNPINLIRFNVIEPIYSVKFFAFPNIVLVFFNAIIIAIVYAETVTSSFNYNLWSYIMLFVGVFLTKSILTGLLNNILDTKKLNKIIHVDFTRILCISGLILAIGYFENSFLFSGNYTKMLLVLSLFFYSWWVLRVIFLLRDDSGFKKFHFFSYLCILEIIPFLFLAIKLAD